MDSASDGVTAPTYSLVVYTTTPVKLEQLQVIDERIDQVNNRRMRYFSMINCANPIATFFWVPEAIYMQYGTTNYANCQPMDSPNRLEYPVKTRLPFYLTHLGAQAIDESDEKDVTSITLSWGNGTLSYTFLNTSGLTVCFMRVK